MLASEPGRRLAWSLHIKVKEYVQSQAQTAIKSLNGKELLGKPISVNEARARAYQGRTGGQEGRGRMDFSGHRNRY